MIYGAEGAATLNADIVINVGVNSYICKLDPTKVDHSPSALPVEQQRVWSIIFYEQVQVDEDTIRLNTKYPNGSNAFNFVAADYASYTYKFRL